MKRYYTQQRPAFIPGFTLVELIIVIVVIAILAAITIVAYSGITQRAVIASVQSDLENANKQLVYYLATNSGYPAAIDCSNTPAANTICLKASNGTTYQYSVNNAVSPQTYFLSATNGSINYCNGSTLGVPTALGCVTNYSFNPSIESSTTGYTVPTYGTGGAGTQSRDTTQAFSGSASLKLTWTTSATGADAGLVTPAINITPGNTYTYSLYIKPSKMINVAPVIRTYTLADGGGSLGSISGTTVVIPANTWTRVSNTVTIPVGYLSAGFRLGLNTQFLAGDTVNFDANMVTDNTTLYNYADGNTTGWIWNGLTNASTSTGPPQ